MRRRSFQRTFAALACCVQLAGAVACAADQDAPLEHDAPVESFARAFGLVAAAFRQAAAERGETVPNPPQPAAYPYDRSTGATSGVFGAVMLAMVNRMADGASCFSKKFGGGNTVALARKREAMSLDESNPFREFFLAQEEPEANAQQCGTNAR